MRAQESELITFPPLMLEQLIRPSTFQFSRKCIEVTDSRCAFCGSAVNEEEGAYTRENRKKMYLEMAQARLKVASAHDHKAIAATLFRF